MHKKDYLHIAEALRNSRPEPLPHEDDEMVRGKAILHAQVCTNIMEALANENPKFNRVKFLEEVNK